MASRNIIVTSALPYANGPIHVGHLVEYLQTDFWVRFQKMRGHQCLNICADDTHGTPIMIRARQEGVTPESLIEKSLHDHLKDFTDFQIEFDEYSSTNTDTNKELVENIFSSMTDGGHISVKEIEQHYCEHDQMFLPDRFVRGACPRCEAPDQYGDSCDQCGATYSSAELASAQCSICGNPSVQKKSEHLFFELEHFQDFLKEWVPQHTQSEVSNKLKEWLDGELRGWDISRDAPYFGFEIPGYKGKYFYVWVDAPVGYMSTTKIWCEKNKVDFEKFWNHKDTEIYHFIGKDILYFHTLFWPAMLKSANYKTPSQVFVHGFLTVNGEKMSKSKGTQIEARHYLNHLDPSYLRYYYACKIRGIDDIDLNLDDFCSRVNSDLIGKITNLASRSGQLLHKKLDGRLTEMCAEGRAIVSKVQSRAAEIEKLYEELNFPKGLTVIRDLADEANRYFDEQSPWTTIKEDPEQAQKVLTSALNIFRVLCIYLKPIIPEYTQKVENLFGEEPYTWESAQTTLENQPLNPYEHLISRIDPKSIEKVLVEAQA